MNQTQYNSLYQKALFKITDLFAVIAGISLTIMMLVTALDVISRFAFRTSIIGAFEMVEFTMAITVPLALAYCEKKRQHICVDLIVQNFPEKSQPWFDLITSIIAFLFYILIAWQCFRNIFEVRADQLTSSVLLWEVWPFTIPCFIGFALLVLLLIHHCGIVAGQIKTGTYDNGKNKEVIV